MGRHKACMHWNGQFWPVPESFKNTVLRILQPLYPAFQIYNMDLNNQQDEKSVRSRLENIPVMDYPTWRNEGANLRISFSFWPISFLFYFSLNISWFISFNCFSKPNFLDEVLLFFNPLLADDFFSWCVIHNRNILWLALSWVYLSENNCPYFFTAGLTLFFYFICSAHIWRPEQLEFSHPDQVSMPYWDIHKETCRHHAYVALLSITCTLPSMQSWFSPYHIFTVISGNKFTHFLASPRHCRACMN